MAKKDQGLKANPTNSISVPCVVHLKDGTPFLVTKFENMPAGNEIGRVAMNDYQNRNGRRPNWPEVNVTRNKMEHFNEPVRAGKITDVQGTTITLNTGGVVKVTKEFLSRYNPKPGLWLVERGSGPGTIYNVVPHSRFKRRYVAKGAGEPSGAAAEKMATLSVEHLREFSAANAELGVDGIIKKMHSHTLQHKGANGLILDFSPGKVLREKLGEYIYRVLVDSILGNVDYSGDEEQEAPPAEPTEINDEDIEPAIVGIGCGVMRRATIFNASTVTGLAMFLDKELADFKDIEVGGALISPCAWYMGADEETRARIVIASIAMAYGEGYIATRKKSIVAEAIDHMTKEELGGIEHVGDLRAILSRSSFESVVAGQDIGIPAFNFVDVFDAMPPEGQASFLERAHERLNKIS